MGHGAAMPAEHVWHDPSTGGWTGEISSLAFSEEAASRLGDGRWAELMATQEPDLLKEKLLGALILLAGDPDMNRHTKFDPQTAHL